MNYLSNADFCYKKTHVDALGLGKWFREFIYYFQYLAWFFYGSQKRIFSHLVELFRPFSQFYFDHDFKEIISAGIFQKNNYNPY